MANDKRLRLNNMQGALGGTMLVGDTTINFGTAPVGLPTVDTTSYLPIVLEPDTTNEEVVYLTAYTAGATTGTIVRAREGSTAVGHGQGTLWIHGPTNIDIPDSVLSRPAGTAYDDEFDGSALAGGWSWVNQGTAAAFVGRSLLALEIPSNASADALHGIVEAAPAAPWEFTAGPFSITMLGAGNGVWVGLVARDSVGGRFMGPGVYMGNAPISPQLSVTQWTSPTNTAGSAFVYGPTPGLLGGLTNIWFRIKDDGTNLIHSYSLNGFRFRQLYTAARTAFLAAAPNQIGFMVDSYNADVTVGLDLIRRTL